jgi:hypothetical protein
MRYFARTIWDRRLPAYSGILVLLLALGLTLMLSRNTAIFVTKATVGSVPKNMLVSNITATSFTVSYVTDESTMSTVAYGAEPNLGEIALDLRDQQLGEPKEHRVHYITVQNLLPGTKYYFSITSGAQVVTDNGSPFEVTTAQQDTTPPPANGTLSGSVALDDGSFPSEGIIYASSETSQLVSTIIQPDGSYSLPLKELRTKDMTSYLPLTGDTKINIQITNGLQESTAIVMYDQSAEIPQIVLSKNYDFTINTDSIALNDASESAQPASQSAGFPVFDEPVAVTKPEITTPTDQQQFKDPQPLFKGKALPNASVQIVIASDKEITASLESDSSGIWEFRPPVALAAGDHIITISSADVNGTLQKLSRTFTVNASGSQFVEPSVSPVEASPTQAPPVTPTVASLPSPTFTPTPTASPSPTMAEPTVDPNAISPTRGPLSPTGSYTTVAGIAMSVLFLASGVILFFLIAV